MILIEIDMPDILHNHRDQDQHQIDSANLVSRIAEIGCCIVAYSGGVDSAVVAAAAMRADQLRLESERCGDASLPDDQRSIAVTASR